MQTQPIESYEGTKGKHMLKLVDCLWTTPIIVVIIILLVLVPWISTTTTFTISTLLILGHLFQYIQAIAYWKREAPDRG